jgi:predicted transposase YbfD/YdcC
MKFPPLLSEWEAAGCRLTREAEPCQKTFEAAAASGHDLRVQVKGPQPMLRRAVARLVQAAPALDRSTRTDLDRRRPTQRTGQGFTAHDLPASWTEPIAAVAQVQRVTDAFSTPTGRWQRSRETRYYAGSRLASAETLAEAIRGHGGSENRVPSVKDLTRREDASRIRQRPGIFARLRSFALNLLGGQRRDPYQFGDL